MINLSRELTHEERDNLSMQEMKKILQQAVELTEDERNDTSENIRSAAMDILSIAGKEGLYDLVPEMFELISSWNPFFREDAVFNLGYWLKIPEFKDIAYEIFVNDEDDDVKHSALLSWSSYYTATKNYFVLEELYKILANENYDSSIRDAALCKIFIVAGVNPKSFDLYTSRLIRCNTPEEFNNKVNWQEVTSLLKKYAPNALKNYPIKWTKADYEKSKNIAKENAITLINKGADLQFISKVTNLSIAEIEELKQAGKLGGK